MVFNLRYSLFPLPLLLACLLFLGSPNRTFGREKANTPPPGADRVITSEELLSAGQTGLWNAICLLDPALDDNSRSVQGDLLGRVTTWATVRGLSAWSMEETENIPLLVVDGARTPFNRLASIDIHDVERVIVVKDPVSLSAYGLQGARGVIEIQTRKNTDGPLSLSYRFNATAEWTDLGSWNRQGTHNRWMDGALRTGFTNTHALDAEGGDEHVGYKFSVRLSPTGKGVMRGSRNDMLGLRSFVEYKYRALHVSNDITFDQVKHTASSYGSLDDLSTLPSDLSSRDEHGEFREVLEDDATGTWWVNPEYEASLGSFNKTKSHALSDRFNLRVTLPAGFDVKGAFSFVRETRRQDIYVSPLSGIYHDKDIITAGRYDILRDNTLSYEGNFSLGWNGRFGKSSLLARGGLRFFSGKYYDETYGGTGILSDRMAYVSFTQTYDTLTAPTARRRYDHTLQGFLAASYAYDGRYGASFATNCNRSSLLSPGEPTACFWGTSLYWNLHNEKFLKDCGNGLSQLTLRASFGTTGGVSFTDKAFLAHYRNETDNEYIYNYYQIGGSLQGMPNRDLRWHTTANRSVSAEMDYKRLSLSVEYYNHLTRDMTVAEPIPAATGFEHRIGNGGKLRNSGVEFRLRALLLQRNDWTWSLSIAGASLWNKIEQIPDYFADYYNKYTREEYPIGNTAAYPPLALQEGRPLSGIYVYEGTEAGENGTTLTGEARYVGSSADLFRGRLGISLSWREWRLGSMLACGFGGYDTNRLAPVPVGNAYYCHNNYMNLSHLQLAYTFAPSVCEKLKMQHLEAVLSGEDIARWRSSHMAEGTYYPLTRRLVFSLRVTF